jgi:transcriptional regulator with XRE-family HTH domain
VLWSRGDGQSGGVLGATKKRLLIRLRELRKIAGLTQEQFAEAAGISYKWYQGIEAGRRSDLRLSTMERIADAYGIGVHQLLAPEMPRVKLKRKST